MKKLRIREFKYLAQDDLARRRNKQDVNSDQSDLRGRASTVPFVNLVI